MSKRTPYEVGVGTGARAMQAEFGDDYAGLLIDRLASTIIDDSLPLKEVERDLRGSVAQVALKKRGLDKRETANRCGVTEKSIENYLKESRNNPKSPEREVARALQDEMLTLEEIYAAVSPILCPTRNFTLDDAKRAVEKLIRTGEVEEYPGHRYRAVERPAIRHPATIESHRDLVDQKARDLDYIVLRQKDASEKDLGRRTQRYSRVVGDSNLVRIDFTVDVDEENLPEFYEKLSAAIAKLTMKEEKKKGRSRVRVLLGMRSVTAMLAVTLSLLALAIVGSAASRWSSTVGSFLAVAEAAGEQGAAAEAAAGRDEGEVQRSWELDREQPQDQDEDDPAAAEDEVEIVGGGGSLDQDDPGVGVADDDDDDYLPPRGRPGDVNLDEQVDLGDVVQLITYLQLGGRSPACPRAGDVDRDGLLDLRDPLLLLRFLYLGEPVGPDFGGNARKPVSPAARNAGGMARDRQEAGAGAEAQAGAQPEPAEHLLDCGGEGMAI